MSFNENESKKPTKEELKEKGKKQASLKQGVQETNYQELQIEQDLRNQILMDTI